MTMNSREGDADVPLAGRRPSKNYTLRAVVKPLHPVASGAAASGKPAGMASVRGENEDDDGYDPYSDYHDGTAGELSFEADPWN